MVLTVIIKVKRVINVSIFSHGLSVCLSSAGPKWIVALPKKIPTEADKTKMLTCLASADPSPRYYWFRNGQEIKTSK